MANLLPVVSLAKLAGGRFPSNVYNGALILEVAVSVVVGLYASAADGPTPKLEAGYASSTHRSRTVRASTQGGVNLTISRRDAFKHSRPSGKGCSALEGWEVR